MSRATKRKGGAVDDDDIDVDMIKAIQDACARAQEYNRKAVLRFMNSEPEDSDPLTLNSAAVMGLIITAIEMEMFAVQMLHGPELTRSRWLALAGDLYDDVTSEDEDDDG